MPTRIFVTSDFFRGLAGQLPQDVIKTCCGVFQGSDQAWVDALQESCKWKATLTNSVLEVSIFSLIGGCDDRGVYYRVCNLYGMTPPGCNGTVHGRGFVHISSIADKNLPTNIERKLRTNLRESF